METPQGRVGVRAACLQVIRGGWAPLIATLVATYILLQITMTVAAAINRGLVWVEAALVPGVEYSSFVTSVPVWLGTTWYAQGLTLTIAAAAVAIAVALTAITDLTWTIRRGDKPTLLGPVRRGIVRALPVTGALLLTGAAFLGTVLLGTALLVAMVVTVPLLLVVWAGSLRWPGLRDRPLKILLALAAPFGVAALLTLRWALWLPIVVDRGRVRGALASSAQLTAARRREVATPLVIVVAIAITLLSGLLALVLIGLDPMLIGVGQLVVVMATVVVATTILALLYQVHASEVHLGPDRDPGMRRLARRLGRVVSRRRIAATLTVALVVPLVTVAGPLPAAVADGGGGATFTVTTTEDHLEHGAEDCASACSLRAALAAAEAAGGGTVKFAVSGVIELLDTVGVRGSATIDGSGQRVTLRSPEDEPALGLYEPAAGSAVYVVRQLTLDGAGRGQGILQGGVPLTVEAVTFTNHQSSNAGAAISSQGGNLTVHNSTFVNSRVSGGAASSGGGAIFSWDGALTVAHSTFTDGTGAIRKAIGAATVVNSIFAGREGGVFNCSLVGGASDNLAGNLSADGFCVNGFADDVSQRTNISNFGLLGLADQGGWVHTLALGPTSPAIGQADPSHCLPVDARGTARAAGSCDAGAYQTSGGTTTTITLPFADGPEATITYGHTGAVVEVSVAHATQIPAGTVTLEIVGDSGIESLTSALIGGRVSFELPLLDAGTYDLTATYDPGDSDLKSSSAADRVTVTKQASALELEIRHQDRVFADGERSHIGQDLTLVARVTSARYSDSGAAPQGRIELFHGATSLGVFELDGADIEQALTNLEVGPHEFHAEYRGSKNFSAAAASLRHAVVGPAAVTITVPPAVVFGTPFDLSASVSAEGDWAAAAPPAAGEMWFFLERTAEQGGAEGGSYQRLGTARVINGEAQLRVDTWDGLIEAGEFTWYADYQGDDYYDANESAHIVRVVQEPQAEVALSGPNTATVAGEPAEFYAEVSLLTPGEALTPSGSVTFTATRPDADPVTGTVDVDGSGATWVTTDLPAGDYTVTALFTPRPATFGAVAAEPTEHVVGQARASITLDVPTRSVGGEPVPLEASVQAEEPSRVVLGGTVEFYAGADLIGAADLEGGAATYTATDLAFGEHSLSARLVESDSYAGTTSPPAAHSVAAAQTHLTLSASAAEIDAGDNVTLIAAVAATPPSAGTPSGTVTFYAGDGTDVLAVAALREGTATAQVEAVTRGKHSFRAVFTSDDDRYTGATGSTEVSSRAITPTVRITSVSPAGSSRFGEPIRVDIAVTGHANIPPSGEVALRYGGTTTVATAHLEDGEASVWVDDVRPSGRTIFSADYEGDDIHASGHTPTGPDEQLIWHEVKRAEPVLRVRTTPNPSQPLEPITVQVTTEPVGGAVPTGPVSVQLFGQHPLVDAAGYFDETGTLEVTLTPNAAPIGSQTIEVRTEADRYFEAVTSHDRSHLTVAGETIVTVSAEPAAPQVGEPVTLVAKVGAPHGIGHVDFEVDGRNIGRAEVGPDGAARLASTFTAIGEHTVIATYDGWGLFGTATSDSLRLPVAGKPTQLSVGASPITYGDIGRISASVSSSEDGARAPTGTLMIYDGERRVGLAGLQPHGTQISTATVVLTADLDPGEHTLRVEYSGDRRYAANQQTALMRVLPAPVTVALTAPTTAVAGEPTPVSAEVRSEQRTAPTGTLTISSGQAACDIHLSGGRTGGTCDLTFDRSLTRPAPVIAHYAGDGRYDPATSPASSIDVGPNRARVIVTASGQDPAAGPAWTTGAPVKVAWQVEPTRSAHPSGEVEVRTPAGKQRCPDGLEGSCEIIFPGHDPGSWVEVRYLGDAAFEPAAGRARGEVLGCYRVELSEGTVRTAPNCGKSGYLHGTRIEMEAPKRSGFTFAGWRSSARPNVLDTGKILVTRDLYLEPRFDPICFRLRLVPDASALRLPMPSPAPNCYEETTADGTRLDLNALQAQELARGDLHYRAGTNVTLRPGLYAAAGMDGWVSWSGEGLTPAQRPAAEGPAGGSASEPSIVMDRDRTLLATLQLPCYTFEVAGPAGAQVSVIRSRHPGADVPLLDRYRDGACTNAESSGGGTGLDGFLPGTELVVEFVPESTMWLREWGRVTPAGIRADDGEELLDYAPEVPREAFPGGRVTTTVTVPAHNARMSAYAHELTCHELAIEVKDAVAARELTGTSQPAAVETSPPNCPSWWLRDQGIAPGQGSWYVHDTPVTVTAIDKTTDGGRRTAFVGEYLDPQEISFHRWSGDITGTEPSLEVVMDDTIAATAHWFVSAMCASIRTQAIPAGAGEVLVRTTDAEANCPEPETRPSGLKVTRTPLDSELILAAQPKGNLEVIWGLEGTNVSVTQECAAHEQYIEETYSRATTRAEGDRRLMEAGYRPGLNITRAQEEAERRHAQGWTSGQIIEHLKATGLLDADGMVPPDRLREDPCHGGQFDTILPAGQRLLPVTATGDLTAKAYFCQAIDPTVRVIGLDGEAFDADAATMRRFRDVFVAGNTYANCPLPGWFKPDTFPVLAASGVGVAGYEIDHWIIDGQQHPAGPVTVPITAERTPVVDLVVGLDCHKLTVNARFGHTAQPEPNCPHAPREANLYAAGTEVAVVADHDGGHVWQGWAETGTEYNPVVVTMAADTTLTAKFRGKNVGEKIMDSVIDPALDALAVGAKKVVGGVVLTVKIVSEVVIKSIVLTGLGLLGDGIALGLNAIGVHGAGVDGVRSILNAPGKALDGAFDGLDCFVEWSWGRSLPDLRDLKGLAVDTALEAGARALDHVDLDAIAKTAREFAERIASGDTAAVAELDFLTRTSEAGPHIKRLALDMADNPQLWEDLGDAALDRIHDFLDLDKGFTWEGSASEAWTSGGDELAACLAGAGESMVR